MSDDEVLKVKVPYTPRRWQAEMHRKLKRFTVLPVHRGAGKSIFAINELVKRAMMGVPNAEYAYILPLRNQAQRNVVDHLKRFVAPIPNVNINNASLTVRFPNGAKLYILGADNPDTLRGMHLHYMVLDEVADMHPDIWVVCRPMLTNHRGGVLFIGTPKGHNTFYDLYMLSQDPANQKDWYGEILPYQKTGALDPDEVELARQTLTENGFQQEMECFPPGSLVAISDGTKAIEEIKIGDLVLTHTGHLRNVKGVMSKPYVGELVVISSYGSRPLRLTPDHPVRVANPSTQSYSWKSAKDIEPSDWLVTPKKHNGMPIISAPLAELIAWFIAEGSVKIRTGKNGVFGKVHTVAREQYSGIVHNLSVAEDESYVVNTRAVHNCSFEAAIRGAYYGQIITEMREAGRITSEKIYRPDLDVITSWDLGVRDRTAIWFYQMVKQKIGGDLEINIIDYVAESNMGLPQWADVLKEKSHHYGYNYGTHIAPFDIKNREFGSGISRLESAEQVGIRFKQCPAQDPMDGIELVRKYLPQCKIYAPLCYDGLEDLSMYRAKIDRQGQGLGPEHSKYSHASDSIRYGITYIVQVMNTPSIMRIPFLRRR